MEKKKVRVRKIIKGKPTPIDEDDILINGMENLSDQDISDKEDVVK